MEDYNKFILSFACILVVGLLILVPMGIGEFSQRKQACRDLGFYKSSTFNNEGVCEDYDGNIHFVKFDCAGFPYNIKCTAKQISIGGVFEIDK